MDSISKVFNWPFLQEPLYRWFIFMAALAIFGAVWAMILGYMKAAAS